MQNNKDTESRNRVMETQKKTFTKWLNNKLATHNFSIVTNLYEDLDNGKVLRDYLCSIGMTPPSITEVPKMRVQKVENLYLILKYLSKNEIRLVNIGAEDIVDKNKKLILGLIFTLILHHGSIIGSAIEQGEFRNKLLHWCQEVTKDYERVLIKDFSKSFKDGLAFNAIIHFLDPDNTDYKSTLGMSVPDRLNYAFNKAKSLFDIETILDINDLLDIDGPDEQCIITYVIEFYRKSAMVIKKKYFKDKVKSISFNHKEYDRAINTYKEMEEKYNHNSKDLKVSIDKVYNNFIALIDSIEELNESHVRILESTCAVNSLISLLAGFEKACMLKSENDIPKTKFLVESINIDKLVDVNVLEKNKAALKSQDLMNFEQLSICLDRYLESLKTNTVDDESLEILNTILKTKSFNKPFNPTFITWVNQILKSVEVLANSTKRVNENLKKSKNFYKTNNKDGWVKGSDLNKFLNNFTDFSADLLAIYPDKMFNEAEINEAVESLSRNSMTTKMIENVKNLLSNEEDLKELEAIKVRLSK
ncbi:ACTNA [Hepatospora eriocheir]|uniref:ACTNA n=1 Tax=Hepatospora eriocheir TaxID=1081669 RepID=A0A1X0QKY9_9MICR|nr:ACTNA [Hepatospora eriocheir]